MAAYWESIGRMLAGGSGTAVPRKRSLFEPEADGPEPRMVVVQEAATDAEPGSRERDARTAKAGHIAASEAEAASPATQSARPPPDAEQATASTFEAQPSGEPPPARPPTARLPEPPPPDPRSALTVTAAPRDQPPASLSAPIPPEPLARVKYQDLPPRRQGEARVAAEVVAAPPSGDEDDGPAQTDKDALKQVDALAVSVAELREHLDTLVEAKPIAQREFEPDSVRREPEAPEARPLVIEIGHIEIAITRPAPPAGATRPAARAGERPVVSLDDYLAQSDGRAR